MKKRCIVITTINHPTEQIVHYSKLEDWTLIVVGDSKTDDEKYKTVDCVYLGLNEQKEHFPSFFSKVPIKSYTRKMFGYLYAIKMNFEVIYDTDDDNKYLGDINTFETIRDTKVCVSKGFTNIYKIFTDERIWPRGIPPTHKCIDEPPFLENLETVEDKVAVIQGLVDNDPDVDAYYRITTCNKPFCFEKSVNYDVVLSQRSICPFNTQNTFWVDSDCFHLLYLPISVNFRYTDILRGVIALFQLWNNGKTIKFTRATAIQVRNEHNLIADYEDEKQMYETIEEVVAVLEEARGSSIEEVYKQLVKINLIKECELEVLQEWNRLVKSLKKKCV